MRNQIIIKNQDDFPDTHHFVYKNKQFPIKIDFFRNSSVLFSNNQIDFNTNKNISLIDDDNIDNSLNLSEESIQNFINYVHRQDTLLNDENIIGINYLAKKYQVISLIKATEEYINNHHQDLILPILLANQNDQSFDLSSYETVLAENFDQYIDDDRLTELKISILYRIIQIYHSKSGRTENGLNQKVIDFLFKCLDKYKREESVLFTFVDIEKVHSQILKTVINRLFGGF